MLSTLYKIFTKKTQTPQTPPPNLEKCAVQPRSSKKKWPLNWIPPSHLRVDDYEYWHRRLTEEY